MAYGLKTSSCDPLILRDSFAKTKKLTYDWQFRALGQSTSSELTWLIQLLFPTIATRWCPRGSWWRQKWIINMWQTVGPLVSVHSVRCSLSDPNSFSDKTWPVITLLIKDFLASWRQLITWLFWTAWSATGDLDCSLSDCFLGCRVKFLLGASTFQSLSCVHST